jgi:hypothetical protein
MVERQGEEKWVVKWQGCDGNGKRRYVEPSSPGELSSSLIRKGSSERKGSDSGLEKKKHMIRESGDI